MVGRAEVSRSKVNVITGAALIGHRGVVGAKLEAHQFVEEPRSEQATARTSNYENKLSIELSWKWKENFG